VRVCVSCQNFTWKLFKRRGLVKIKQSSVLFGCLVLVLALLLPIATGCGTTTSGPKVYELKWAGFDPPQAFPIPGIMTPWKDKIEKDSNGRVKITLYPSESLGKGPDQYQMVLNRVCDISNIMPPFTPGLFPLAEFIELPHLFPSAEICGRVATEMMNKYAASGELKDVKLLWVLGMTNQQPQSARELKKLEDWKGLKCMAEGKLDAQIVEALGASPVPMPMPEVFTGLQSGLIQAVNMSWEGTMAFKINEATKYRVKYDMYSKAFLVFMNKDLWNSLPSDIQQVFEKNGGPDQGALAGKAFENACNGILNGPIGEYDKKMGNPGLYVLPDAEAARWTAATAPVIDRWVKEKQDKGLQAKAMLDEAKALIQKYSK
jgi:TRAP-type C4-dicarboxylate transport system substrate-binding protein